MAGDHFLDLVGIDVETGDQDHVLLAVDQEDKALVVHITEVAGAQKTVGVEDARCLVRPLPVTLGNLRTADTDFTDLGAGYFLAGIIAYRNFCRRDRQADRAVESGQVERVDGHRW